jgi:hypothetical protein
MGWAGHVARMEERKVSCRILVGNVKKTDHLEGQDLDGRIILKWILKK